MRLTNSCVLNSNCLTATANIARTPSLPANASVSEVGIVEMARSVVRRTARLIAKGTIAIAMRVAARKPIPKYINGSIANSPLVSSEFKLADPYLTIAAALCFHGLQ